MNDPNIAEMIFNQAFAESFGYVFGIGLAIIVLAGIGFFAFILLSWFWN